MELRGTTGDPAPEPRQGRAEAGSAGVRGGTGLPGASWRAQGGERPLRDLSLRVLRHCLSRGEVAGRNNPLVTPETFGTRAAFEDGPNSEDVPGGYGLGSTPAVPGGFCPGNRAPIRKSPAPPELGSSPPGRSGSPLSPPRRPGLHVLGQNQRKGDMDFSLGKGHPLHFAGPS